MKNMQIFEFGVKTQILKPLKIIDFDNFVEDRIFNRRYQSDGVNPMPRDNFFIVLNSPTNEEINNVAKKFQISEFFINALFSNTSPNVLADEEDFFISFKEIPIKITDDYIENNYFNLFLGIKLL